MVIHDETRVEAWTQERVEQQQQQEKPRSKIRLSVIGVQGIACAVMVLLALLLRVAGGETYETLRQRFQQALARNELATAIALLWEDNPLDKAEESDVKPSGFTEEESAQLVDSSAVVTAVPPLESGTLTSGFGERIHPINGNEEFHSGVDIAAIDGTPLMAMYDGEVVEVGENDTLGRYIRMRHQDNIEVVYAHCNRVVAQQGETIKAGEEVALVGSTGESTGSHVHVSITVDGEVFDPSALLSLERYA